MTKEPHPEHALARTLMDKLAKAAGLPSGQALMKHLDGLKPDDAGLKLIGETIKLSTEPPKPAEPAKASTNPDLPPGPEPGSLAAEVA